MENIVPFDGKRPEIHPSAYIDPSSRIVGDVKIGENVSIWTNAVLRADENSIRIQKGVAVLENTFLEAPREFELVIEQESLLAHGGILHGCTIHKECMIGIGAIILDGAVIGEGSIVAAGALVPENKIIPPRSVVVGSPGKVVKEVTEQDFERVRGYHKRVLEKAMKYKEMLG